MQLDKDKLKKILSEMGYSVEFNSDTPGLYIGNKKYDWNSIIPNFLKNDKQFDTVYYSSKVRFTSTNSSSPSFISRPVAEYRYKGTVKNFTRSNSIYKVNITNKHVVRNFALGKAV
ncbi:hypothetical protein [Limosilactobacillus albertensis]|uniref:Uncharacterized protein n=1 Tax=Limosilactobacillus albertensis TaxID=2759752 RepID=A0A839GX62_9LACO|nr:hypothetical protein [Limosilactobacillus albertensis]MBB1122703.1 hypothetical protein [Limosilactobacillus albertensis]MCD7122275.1 hypothetical protein [Limosilactobacillus albertensis]